MSTQTRAQRQALDAAVIRALLLGRDRWRCDPLPVGRFRYPSDARVYAAACIRWAHHLGLWVEMWPKADDGIDRGWFYVAVLVDLNEPDRGRWVP